MPSTPYTLLTRKKYWYLCNAHCWDAVSSVVSKELLTCHRNDTRYIFFSLVNKYDPVIGLDRFHFLYYNASQMTMHVICGLFYQKWAALNFSVKNERHILLLVSLLKKPCTKV